MATHMDELTAHQLSTVSSVLLLGFVIWRFVRLYPPSSGQEAISIGLLWVALTVAFEFLFFITDSSRRPFMVGVYSPTTMY